MSDRQDNFPFIPSSPSELSVGPLNRGVISNTSPSKIISGGFQELQNYISTPAGLKRRAPYQQFSSGTVDDDALYMPLQDLFVFWIPDGTQYTILLDDKFMYTFNVDGDLTRKSWDYTKGGVTVTVVGTAVTASADAEWDDAANECKVGDVLAYDTGGTAKFGTITEITDDDELVLATSPGDVAGKPWHIRRAFASSVGRVVDWTVTPENEALFADGARHLYSFDGADFTDFQTANAYAPACVSYFQERVFMGNIVEAADNAVQHRIRWSEAGDYDDFVNGGYIDLPYAQSEIRRLVPLGKTLMCYMEDAIFVGLPSNDVNLPVNFGGNRYETGGLGLAGPRAICTWRDRHYLAMQDNLYTFSLQKGLEPIGDKVARRTMAAANEEFFWKIRVAPDLRSRCILFGLPIDSENISQIWAYNYETGGWSRWPIAAETLSIATVVDNTTWATVAGTWAAQTKQWIDFQSPIQIIKNLYFSREDAVFFFSSDGSLDEGTSTIPAGFITPDYDHKQPSATKTWLDFGLKLVDPPNAELNFEVAGSVDRGKTWKELGTISIATTDSEGRVSFRLTGSSARFRVTSHSETNVYTICEYTMRVRGLGKEVPGRET